MTPNPEIPTPAARGFAERLAHELAVEEELAAGEVELRFAITDEVVHSLKRLTNRPFRIMDGFGTAYLQAEAVDFGFAPPRPTEQVALRIGWDDCELDDVEESFVVYQADIVFSKEGRLRRLAPLRFADYHTSAEVVERTKGIDLIDLAKVRAATRPVVLKTIRPDTFDDWHRQAEQIERYVDARVPDRQGHR